MEYKSDLKGLAIFELKSWLGRKFLNTTPKLDKQENYLNLGCGSNVVSGYVNADFFYRFKFWKKDIQQRQWQLDLRYPLDCPDNVFDGIFTEHTLEHLYPDDAKRLLTEVYRILKPNSLVRITVPDVEKYVKFYTNTLDNDEKFEFTQHYQTGCSAIRNMTQNYFHFSAWDCEELNRYLADIGFKDIKKQSFGITANPKLNLDLKERSWETLYLEARK